MAKFEIAEAITGRNEGGYANNPADTGGETYAGIARKHWPNWRGWGIIDQIKNSYGTAAATINRQAQLNPSLTIMISEFYKKNFWDVNRLDDFYDQQIANTVYDFGVNSGTGRAAKYLQSAVGVTQDGKIGPKTIAEVNRLDSSVIYGKYNAARETFYKSIAIGNQAQFLKSWLRRLKKYQKA